MSITQSTIDEIKRLSVSEKIRIVEEIWDSIMAQEQYPDLTEQQSHTLNTRLDSYHANPSLGRTWDDIKAKFFASGQL
ncbi:MAG: addiction module protein [Candidatus Methylumidiphilus sp.]